MVKLLSPKVPVKPVTSIIASVVALNPAVASLIATKVRAPKVNRAAELAIKKGLVNLAAIPGASSVATDPTSENTLRAVETRNKSLPARALKSVTTSKLLRRESVKVR